MGQKENIKNVIEDSEISAKGDVNIGDRTTINVYGLKANASDLRFAIKVYVALIAIFALASVVFLLWPKPEIFPNDYVASFASGGFFGLGSLILIAFIRSIQNSSIKSISNEIQNNS